MALPDLDLVARLIREVANAEALPRWRHLGAGDVVEKNGPDDVVTVADRAVEAVLTQRLVEVLPGSAVVGEEAVHTDPRIMERLRASGQVWVIDPIDGTSAFARGEPGFAVMVALITDGVPVAGWLHAPVLRLATYGAHGQGVWQQTDGAPVRLPKPVPVAGPTEMIGIVGTRAFSKERRAAVLGRARSFKTLTDNSGCAGIDYPELAAGRIHFALYSKSEPWDHLPGLAILAEQGFHAAKHDGTPYRPGDNTGGLLIAPSRAHWLELRRLLLE